MNIIKLSIKDKIELAKLYIQQFKYGGIFIVNNLEYRINDEVFLLLNIAGLDGGELAINTRVAWWSPDSTVNYPAGIGLEFKQDKVGVEAKAKIEIFLGGMLENRTLSSTF